MQPLFDIQELFFHITHVVCNLEYKAKGHIEPTLEVSASLKKIPRKQNIWHIGLSVSTPANMDNITFPYEFFLNASATLIHVPPEEMTREQFKQIKKLLYVNGASVLYSAMRDRLLLLTGNSLHHAYCLPSFRFNPDDFEDLDKKRKENHGDK